MYKKMVTPSMIHTDPAILPNTVEPSVLSSLNRFEADEARSGFHVADVSILDGTRWFCVLLIVF